MSSQKQRILEELAQLTEPHQFARIAQMIDAGQGWFELPNPVTVWTEPGESDYDTLVTAVTLTEHPDILRSLVEYFDAEKKRYEPPESKSTIVSEPMPIYGLSEGQQRELERRYELHKKGIGTYYTWEEAQQIIRDRYGV